MADHTGVHEVGFTSAKYYEEVERVATQLEEGRYSGLETEAPFVMAVFSEWGTGKTHFVGKVAARIESHYASPYLHPELTGDGGKWVMWFNPWSFREPSKLVEAFLDQLGYHISQLPVGLTTPAGDKSDKSSPTRDEVCDAVRDLGTTMVALGGMASIANASLGVLVKALGEVAKAAPDSRRGLKNLFRKEPEKANETDTTSDKSMDLRARKEHVSELLSKLLGSNRIVVIIDDIDRLSNENIRLVFQLVAAMADFPNLSYLLVYDERVVIKALDGIHGSKGGEDSIGAGYIDKVVHRSYNLPQLKLTDLASLMVEDLKKELNQSEKQWFGRLSTIELNASDWIATLAETVRGIHRLEDEVRMRISHRPSPLQEGGMGDMLIAESLLSRLEPNLYARIAESFYRQLPNLRSLYELIVKSVAPPGDAQSDQPTNRDEVNVTINAPLAEEDKQSYNPVGSSKGLDVTYSYLENSTIALGWLAQILGEKFDSSFSLAESISEVAEKLISNAGITSKISQQESENRRIARAAIACALLFATVPLTASHQEENTAEEATDSDSDTNQEASTGLSRTLTQEEQLIDSVEGGLLADYRSKTKKSGDEERSLVSIL